MARYFRVNTNLLLQEKEKKLLILRIKGLKL